MRQENLSNEQRLVACADIAYGIMSRTKGLPRILDSSERFALDCIQRYETSRSLVMDSMPIGLLKEYDRQIEEAKRYFEYIPPTKKSI